MPRAFVWHSFPLAFLFLFQTIVLGSQGKFTGAMNIYMNEIKEQRYSQSKEGQGSGRA